MSPISIHHRINRRLISGSAALLVIFGAALGWLFVHDLSREFDRALESKAAAVAGLSDSGIAATVRFSDVTLPDGRKGRQVIVDYGPPRIDLVSNESTAEITTVIATEPRSVLLWKIVQYSLTLAGFLGFLLLAQALLVRNVLRRGLEPVVGLRRQIEILDPQHRGQRVSLQAPPAELAPVLRRINDLLAQADHSIAPRRGTAR